jgi:PAS domain S-box-containing protein
MSAPVLAVDDLRQENELLRREVRVAREAAQITAQAVIAQFQRTEEILGRLQLESARRQAVLQAARQVGIIGFGLDGVIRVFNSGAELLLGWNAAEVVGRQQPTLFHLPSELAAYAAEVGAPDGLRAFFAGALRGVTQHRDWTYVRKDGALVPVDLSVTPLPGEDGSISGVLCVALDLTARQKAEREIREAMEAAQSANRMKSAFLASMSHELRTPLNAIIGFAELVQEDAPALGAAELVPDVRKIENAGRHLLALINDVLDLSKIEAGKVELLLEELDLPQALLDVQTMVQPLLQRNGNTLLVDCPPELLQMRADVTRTRQVLFNLLSNAAKFTHKGTVRLIVRSEPGLAGERLSFAVSDEGIGMSAEQMSRLFQPFSQADASTTKQYGGTGLGLSITKRLCELMGGEVTVESSLGRGATFTARLPRDVEAALRGTVGAPALASHGHLPAVSTAEARVGPAGASAATLLAIDDEPATLELLRRVFEREGYRVATAGDGESGLALAREIHPDVITLDVLMPGKDGWSVLADLKGDLATAEIPVVMLTCVDGGGAGFALGAAEHLVKPVDRDRLAAVVRKYLPSAEHGPTVLVVDDDVATRHLVHSALGRHGYTVVEAEHGRAALDLLAVRSVDLVLLDLMMPVMDGFEFLDALRQKGTGPPVVVVTAKELTVEDRERLNGHVQTVVRKGGAGRFLEQVREQVAACVGRRG